MAVVDSAAVVDLGAHARARTPARAASRAALLGVLVASLACQQDAANASEEEGAGKALDTTLAAAAEPPDLHPWLGVCPVAAPPDWRPVSTAGPAGERVLGCLRRIGSATDDRIPLQQRYELTTFGGPGDEQPTHCEAAPDADNTWYYAANEQRFGCGTRARLVDDARRKCVIVEVADLGPNICVEEASAAPTWDVAPLVSMELFGARQAGWSEHRKVLGAPVAPDTPLGPCDHQQRVSESLTGGVGGACQSDADCALPGATCLGPEAGFPGGYCTASCQGGCSARVGPYPFAVCAPLLAGPDGERCMAACDYTLYATGCRDGYTCGLPPELRGSESLPGSLVGPPEIAPVCIPARCGG